jgi:hypothetical protein
MLIVNFKQWLVLENKQRLVLENIKNVLTEGLQDLDSDKQRFVVDYIDRWGANAAKSPVDYKRINWTSHWSNPENVEKLRDILADKLIDAGDDLSPQEAKRIMVNALTSVHQKNVGFGSRRNMEMARRHDLDPEEFLHPDFKHLQMPGYAQHHPESGSQPIQRKVGHTLTRGPGGNPRRAERWNQWRADKEERERQGIFTKYGKTGGYIKAPTWSDLGMTG